MSLVVLRDKKDSDLAFIRAKWARSYLSRRDPTVKEPIYFSAMDRLIERLCARSFTVVGAFNEDTDTIACFAVFGDDVIHYVWVDNALRNTGLAKTMLARFYTDDKKPVIYTHKTRTYNIPSHWEYDPYLAWEIAFTT